MVNDAGRHLTLPCCLFGSALLGANTMSSPFIPTTSAAFQLKEDFRGQGIARAAEIQRGHLPPVRRVFLPKTPTFVPVEDAAVNMRQQSRSSVQEDFNNIAHSPDAVYNAQVAAIAFETCGDDLPE